MPQMQLDSYICMSARYELIHWKKSNDDIFLISCPAERNEQEITVNHCAFDVLKLLDGTHKLQEIERLLQKQYPEDIQELKGKVRAFLQDLAAKGVVESLDMPEKRKKEPIVIKSDYWLKKLQIELTSKCNLRCKHCYFYEDKKSKDTYELPFSKIKDIVDEVKRMGAEVISLTGGEPFMRNDIYDVLTYIESKNMAIVILTNGTLIDQKVAQKISTFKNLYVTISLDGPQSAHERLRGVKGCFDKTLDAIRHLLSVGLTPQINLTLNRETLGGSSELVTILKRLGLQKPPRIGIALNLGRASENNESITIGEFAKEFETYWKAVISVFGFEKYPVRTQKTRNCGVGDESLVITSEGNIVPCPPLNREPFILGNVYHKRISDVWINSKMLQKIREIDTHKNRKCSSCKHWEYCGGGCRVSAMISSGGVTDRFFDAPNPFACARWSVVAESIKILDENSDDIALSQLI